ncbi:S41 family peptidase [Antarcticibacterium flavum]|uniref:S41 family peptidase n=1 Tax=Antarcticibacterium flavum TaxID=2058175 RepID=A0A5B7X4H2_9FLAO|nr:MULTISPECIES: S41 family peptidase [Antarcticibacterium]MCM4160074.1 peptidase S41 [Antarcticibacterium sp. W02-3]QCY69631.1 S41 family peptidase [Antarcticibacterium flavum]
MKNLLLKKISIIVLGAGLLVGTTGFVKSDFFAIAKQLEIFTTLFKELNMNYVDETNPAALMDTAIKAMLEDLDPYTNYWNEQDVEAARMNTAGEYQGIGAAVKITREKFIILEAYKDFPADKAGLKAGDEIIKIGGLPVADYREDAGELLNGAPNSTIDITYRRQGKLENTTITRGTIELKAVPFYELLEDNTGYIVLSRFNSNASSETIRALKELQGRGADKIILDLRGNPGGLLSEAILVSNIFINKGQLITSTKSVIEKYNQQYFTPNEPINTKIPLAVLIDGRSASASEIVAGAIQDLDRGIVVGARSFGKGLVQRPKELVYGTQLKLTISRYYTPSGRCIQALDYRERDEEGNAVRIGTNDYNEFKTKSGRSVYDGGGILPDITLKTSEYSAITNALLAHNAIFDFATNYYYSNNLERPEDFTFTDADFNNFRNFLEQTDFSYETRTEAELSEAIATARKEGFDQDIISGYKQMMDGIEKAKKAEVESKKEEISSLLTDEIIKRYFYQEGLYNYYLQNNPEILEAQQVLNNPGKYSAILR